MLCSYVPFCGTSLSFGWSQIKSKVFYKERCTDLLQISFTGKDWKTQLYSFQFRHLLPAAAIHTSAPSSPLCPSSDRNRGNPPSPQQPTAPDQPPPTPLCLTRNQVRRKKTRKATGPDNMSSRLLRECADMLCEVVLFIFNMNLSLEKIPVLWRTSCLVLVQKVPRPMEPKHFRPVGFLLVCADSC